MAPSLAGFLTSGYCHEERQLALQGNLLHHVEAVGIDHGDFVGARHAGIHPPAIGARTHAVWTLANVNPLDDLERRGVDDIDDVVGNRARENIAVRGHRDSRMPQAHGNDCQHLVRRQIDGGDLAHEPTYPQRLAIGRQVKVVWTLQPGNGKFPHFIERRNIQDHHRAATLQSHIGLVAICRKDGIVRPLANRDGLEFFVLSDIDHRDGAVRRADCQTPAAIGADRNALRHRAHLKSAELLAGVRIQQVRLGQVDAADEQVLVVGTDGIVMGAHETIPGRAFGQRFHRATLLQRDEYRSRERIVGFGRERASGESGHERGGEGAARGNCVPNGSRSTVKDQGHAYGSGSAWG